MKIIRLHGLVIKVVGIILSLNSLTGCSVSSDNITPLEINDNLYIVDVDHAGKTERILYSTLFDTLKTIILDTTQAPLIGSIDKMVVYNDALFILDWTQAKVLYMFDFEGNFVRKFGAKGGGPGEYAGLADFTIDTDNNIIYLFDNQRHRINAYDIVSGNFLRSIDLDRKDGVLSHHIQYVNGSIFADAYFSTPSPDNFLLRKIDLLTGEQQASFLNADRYNKGWTDLNIIDSPVFCKLNADTVLFTHKFMDQVIMISKQTVKPYLELKGKDLMRFKDVKNIDQNQDYFNIVMELRNLNRIYNIRSCVKYGDSIFIECRKGGNFLSVLFDIKTGKTKYVYLKDDLLFTSVNTNGFLPSFGCATSEGQFYFIDSDKVNDLKISIENGRLSPDVDQFDRLKTLNDNANPVIFFYRYK